LREHNIKLRKQDDICRHMDVVAKVHAFTPPIGFSREDGSGLIFIPGEAA
jgi:hypothetical protein